MVAKKKETKSGWNEAGGVVLVLLGVLLTLSFLSYTPDDISILKSPPNHPASNFIGPAGAYSVFALFMTIGVAGYLMPVMMVIFGILYILKREEGAWIRWFCLLFIIIALSCVLEIWQRPCIPLMEGLNISSAGGVIGYHVGRCLLVRLIGEVGTLIVGFGAIVVGLLLMPGLHPFVPFRVLGEWCAKLYHAINAWILKRMDRVEQLRREAKDVAQKRERLERAMEREEREKKTKKRPAKKPAASKPARKKKVVAKIPLSKKSRVSEEMVVPEIDGIDSNFKLPPLDILDKLPKRRGGVEVDIEGNCRILEETLHEFGIEAQVTGVDSGPVVTSYEILPPPGIRVEKIAGLSNNIALALRAESVRVQAPIPGKGVVGIEIPNGKSQVVYLREVLESKAWNSKSIALPLALGKDVTGNVVVADLADMPHLLIAGATGAGKTVCMNSILTGLLMARKPEELRLMLIDPKIVEFSNYNHLPHLVVPVITDAKKVGLGFRWVINEMEKRYKLFNRAGVRNIKAFNNRPIIKQTDMFEDAQNEGKKDIPGRVPYIVVVVDELADLMSVAQAEIENSIARLAQLSRAVGIHMILATQRPSVNIITGTIKANFPARIAFQVAQKVDSRTILDTVGADKLLGKGDLLYSPPGSSKLIRSQGAFANDDEINRVIAFLKEQGKPKYESEVKDKIEGKTVDLPELNADDELLPSAVEIVRQTRRASTSSLQRRLRIGYTRAARLMDILEEKGIVGPPNGSEPREILIDLDGDIPENPDESEVVDDENQTDEES